MTTKLNTDWQQAQSAKVQKMVRAIRRQLDAGQLEDVASHGADVGWPGFTYTADTVAFYRRHEDAIWELLSDEADAYGYDNVPAFIASFNGARNVGDEDQFKNLLAWYALESVARCLTDLYTGER